MRLRERMKLEEIGFYTLTDHRARTSSATSPLWRCELILTDKCNFRCPYCRGVSSEYSGTMPIAKAQRTIDLWVSNGLKNVRFSGGEPLLYKALPDLVRRCQSGGVEKIAVSSNGSLPLKFYLDLIEAGVNDFSISLDACCAAVGDKMAGNLQGSWDKVVSNIQEISKRVYTTVGIVVTDDNMHQLRETVEFAHNLGVADIRVIPAAQTGEKLQSSAAKSIPQHILNAHPILRYRVTNIHQAKAVRGLSIEDSPRCYLVLDDMSVIGDNHFPCIIYLRERGKPIGKVGPNMRKERDEWSRSHNVFVDPICRRNCLDVCKDYSNRCQEMRHDT